MGHNSESSEDSGHVPRPALLETRALTRRFGGLVAVKDFSVQVREGELVGLIGPNGAGKTTVFNLVTGMYEPSSGRILFHGADVGGLRPYQVYARGIARTFQNIRLFGELSVLDNVRVAYHHKGEVGVLDSILRTRRYARGEKQVTERTLELLSILGLLERRYELARNLPYGEQRRLEIARALVAEPKLLLLDEPAAGMNPFEVGRLMELIQLVKERFRLTVFLIEHQMKVVMGVCERVIVMEFGTVICTGRPEEVQCDEKVVEAYLGKTDKRH